MLAACDGQLSLQGFVAERGGLVSVEEAPESPVQRVGDREGLWRPVLASCQPRGALLAISCSSPLSAAASSLALAARNRLVAARTWGASSALNITNFVLLCTE